MLVEIYPPSLRDAGLRAALSDLASPLAAHDIEATVDLPEDLQFPADVEALLYRAAQEAIRNVVTHARARHVGVGFDPKRLANRPAEGHVGLRVLADLAADAGGRFEVVSHPGNGTRVHLEVPTR